ncbi:MAG: DoxX family protein, partial [Planctomycetes bacterium]|nr:DoxX family protein [Planctomycetota bacterium]
MVHTYEVARALSITAFAYFGTCCLVSTRMVTEFERFGLSRFRVLTGLLQLLGALALILGHSIPMLVTLGSAGLAVLMGLGILTRARVADPVVV